MAQTDRLVLVYTLAAVEYYGTDASLDLIGHPTGGGWFADDAVPANLDPIADYGRMGFNSNPGYLPCPDGPTPAVESSWGAVKNRYH